jgi:hypothetical protein
MSRQFRFYLLPSDIERVLVELRVKFSVKLIEEISATLPPVEIDAPFRPSLYSMGSETFTSVRCLLTPPSGAEIKSRYMTKRKLWSVDIQSEVIEFSDCDFDGSVLLIGRFYFQTDFLLDQTIWRKRPEFLDWADKVFRTTKRMLHWSKKLDAYVGKDAARWRQDGGRFVSLKIRDGKPVFEDVNENED